MYKSAFIALNKSTFLQHATKITLSLSIQLDYKHRA